MPTNYIELNDFLAQRGLAAPETGQMFYYDAKTAGLALRVTANNSRAFVVTHWEPSRRKTLRYKLGDATSMSVDAARSAVAERKGNVAIGREDPFKRTRQAVDRITLRRVFKDYLSDRDLKERTVRDYTYRIESEAFEDWLDKPLDTITRDDVERRHKKLGAVSRSRARGAMVVLRLLFNYAIAKYEHDGKPVFVDNPTVRLKARAAFGQPDRKSSAIPLRLMPAWFKAARDNDAIASLYLQCVALTGLRRNEAARIRWIDVDLEGDVYEIVDTKNKVPLKLPITRQLRAIFEHRWRANKQASVRSVYVFPAQGRDEPIKEPRKTLDAICRVIEYPSSIHDLRRSFVNAADASGCGFMVLKLLINHRLPKSSDGVTMGYGTADSDRMREAAQRIADILDGTAKSAQAISIKRARS